MEKNQHGQNLHYTLRIAAAICFIGHGAFEVITKPIWFNYFEVFGIHHAAANALMPVVGITDILMGVSLLIYPTRLIYYGLSYGASLPPHSDRFQENQLLSFLSVRVISAHRSFYYLYINHIIRKKDDGLSASIRM